MTIYNIYLDAFLQWSIFMSACLAIYLLRGFIAKGSVKFQKESFGIETTQSEMERGGKIVSIAGAVVFTLIFLFEIISSIING